MKICMGQRNKKKLEKSVQSGTIFQFATKEAPPGGGTQSRNHADLFSLSRIHAMRGKFGFSRNIAKFV